MLVEKYIARGMSLEEARHAAPRVLSSKAIFVTPPRMFPGDPPEQVKSALVTPNFFDVLGVRAAHGRVKTGAPVTIDEIGSRLRILPIR